MATNDPKFWQHLAEDSEQQYAAEAKHAIGLEAEIERLRAENERLQALAQGRLEHFQHSEESRFAHFRRAERFKAALEEIAEGCGHTRCHAYPWIRAARKALGA